jgi:hypothetical protein
VNVAFWLICVLAIGVSATCPDRCEWIARAGGFIVAFGIGWQSWPILTTRRRNNLAFWGTQEGHTAIRHAIVAAIFGTLLWAYGEPICSALSRWISRSTR